MNSDKNVPPLTVISKGRAIAPTTVSAKLLLQQVKLVQKVPPLTLISKQLNQGGPLISIPKRKILNSTVEKGNTPGPRSRLTAQTQHRLTAQTQHRLTAQSRPRLTAQSRRKLISKPQPQIQQQLVVKKYDNVSAPAPFFGTYSKIPGPIKAALTIQQGLEQDEEGGTVCESGQNTDEVFVGIPDANFHGYGDDSEEITIVLESISDSDYFSGLGTITVSRQNKIRDIAEMSDLDYDVGLGDTYNEIRQNTSQDIDERSDSDFAENLRATYHENEVNLNDFVIETADKAVQTDCFCNCEPSQRSDINDLTREVAMLKVSINDLKVNISGKKIPQMMGGLFPIKTTRDLEKIEFNVKNTENFAIRLTLYLKYLKPKLSISIKTAFKELVADEFLDGKNWDGSKGQLPLNIYEFFNTTLFDSWKNSSFTKDIYIDAMKSEIKKAHDRLNQQKMRYRKLAQNTL